MDEAKERELKKIGELLGQAGMVSDTRKATLSWIEDAINVLWAVEQVKRETEPYATKAHASLVDSRDLLETYTEDE